jgi:hypothetical protein
MTTTRTEYQIVRLAGLQMGFDVDVSAALHLTGQELDTWLNSTEDELFAKGLQDLKEMQIERQRGYLNSGFESR